MTKLTHYFISLGDNGMFHIFEIGFQYMNDYTLPYFLGNVIMFAANSYVKYPKLVLTKIHDILRQ